MPVGIGPRHGTETEMSRQPNPIRSDIAWSTRVRITVRGQPQALAGTEPGIACSQPLRADVFRPDLRIEQPHGGLEMRQFGKLLCKLLFKLTQRCGQFRRLVS